MKLFEPILLGDLVLSNRVFMAPMTRGRAGDEGIPNELMAEYYSQRASAGLIIAEATAISREGHGWPGSPGIYTSGHVKGWKKVTEAVHNSGGRIFLQIFHMGRTVLPEYVAGTTPVSSSPVRAEGEIPGRDGKPRKFVVPRQLSIEEISLRVSEFARAAEYAMDAGFDGVEIHAANNFLIDSFLRDGTNKRDDIYGGSAENRSRFLMEVTREVVDRIGADVTGVRISPTNGVFGISDSEPEATFTTVARKLSDFRLAYLHILEPPSSSGHFMASDIPNTAPAIRGVYDGTVIMNGGFELESAEKALSGGEADAVAFGSLFISNPDLVDRLRKGLALSMPDPDTFYTPGAEGYTDYPVGG